MPQSPCVLVVDDEPIILETLVDNLQDTGYETVQATSGEEAWRLLCDAPDRFEAVLLDRVMPDMDGIKVLHLMKGNPDLSRTPVIMQTSMNADAEIAEGLRAGAYYYLTKPFAAETLLAIVAAAIKDRNQRRDLEREARSAERTLVNMHSARFGFRTPAEARAIATLISGVCPDPGRVVLGLSELMLNAVEHGNLGITYAEKTVLIREGRLGDEINRRLALPGYAEREASLEFERGEFGYRFTIRDHGQGFDWHEFLDMRPERAFDTHGRGIAMSRLISFDQLNYVGKGNEVVALLKHPESL